MSSQEALLWQQALDLLSSIVSSGADDPRMSTLLGLLGQLSSQSAATLDFIIRDMQVSTRT
jgi:hypothetical protein